MASGCSRNWKLLSFTTAEEAAGYVQYILAFSKYVIWLYSWDIYHWFLKII